MRVIWSTRALRRLDQIHARIAKDNPQAANQMIDRLLSRGGQIADHPSSGRMVPEYRQDDIRELIEKPYRIIYEVGNDQVEILTVHHGAQLMPAWVDDV